MLKNILFSLFLYIFYIKNAYTKLQILDEVSAIVNQDVILKNDVDMILKKNSSYLQNSAHSESIQNNLKNEILNYLICDYIIKNSTSQNSLSPDIYSTEIFKKINEKISEIYIKYHEIKRQINIDFYELDSLSKIIFLRENKILLNLAHFIIPLIHDTSINKINEFKKSQIYILNLIKNQNVSKKKL
ncbi:peptidylprolyl isomerase family protein [Wigglesworthia glossinidia]|uniref:hypothetical protein n=1 Tax=Wigglesworthia glossinidia TaxID=51229 RepID=UPI0005A50097|nr:hypothetical protein [Wigglesworthia glossinidia]